MSKRSVHRMVQPGLPCCFHITQRCQERRMLFRWAKDRLQYLRRLREASLRYPVSVLNYMVTGNHVHLLSRAENPVGVADAMQFLSGCAAQEYNRRKKREGAFWRGRYRPTLVESGRHLTRCFFYIELNMVRAGVVCRPEEWVGGAFREHSGERKRHRSSGTVVDGGGGRGVEALDSEGGRLPSPLPLRDHRRRRPRTGQWGRRAERIYCA